MYYAGYRVLPEAPLREDWVQVIVMATMSMTIGTMNVMDITMGGDGDEVGDAKDCEAEEEGQTLWGAPKALVTFFHFCL